MRSWSVILTSQRLTVSKRRRLGREYGRLWVFVSLSSMCFHPSDYFQLLREYPDLERYCDCWPVDDLMQTHLKAIGARKRRYAKRATVNTLMVITFGAATQPDRPEIQVALFTRVVIICFMKNTNKSRWWPCSSDIKQPESAYSCTRKFSYQDYVIVLVQTYSITRSCIILSHVVALFYHT